MQETDYLITLFGRPNRQAFKQAEYHGERPEYRTQSVRLPDNARIYSQLLCAVVSAMSRFTDNVTFAGTHEVDAKANGGRRRIDIWLEDPGEMNQAAIVLRWIADDWREMPLFHDSRRTIPF